MVGVEKSTKLVQNETVHNTTQDHSSSIITAQTRTRANMCDHVHQPDESNDAVWELRDLIFLCESGTLCVVISISTFGGHRGINVARLLVKIATRNQGSLCGVCGVVAFLTLPRTRLESAFLKSFSDSFRFGGTLEFVRNCYFSVLFQDVFLCLAGGPEEQNLDFEVNDIGFLASPC